MRKLLLIGLCIGFSLLVKAQTVATRTITGTVLDAADREPLIGCSIMIPGTTYGAITDLDGRFSLTFAPEQGQQLEVSYIGYGTQRVAINSTTDYQFILGGYYNEGYPYIYRNYSATVDPVTVKTVRGRLLNSVNKSPIQNAVISVHNRGFSTKTDDNGYFVLEDVADTDKIYVMGESMIVAYVADSILSIRKVPVFSHQIKSRKDTVGVFYMKNDLPSSYNRESYMSISRIKKTGKRFQIKETKSRNVPSGVKLNYTSFINIGTVAKLPDVQYTPKDFFRTGISFGNMADIKLGGFKKSVVSVGLGQKKDNSPLPATYREAYNTSLMIRNMQTGLFTSDASILYKSSYGKHTLQGANISNLMYAVLTEPSHFEYIKAGWKNLPDRIKNDDLLAYVKTRMIYKKVEAFASLQYDKKWNDRHNGSYIGSETNNLLTQRKQNTSNTQGAIEAIWKIKDYGPQIDLVGAYTFRHIKDKIEREDILSGSSSPWHTDKKLIRNTQDVVYGIKIFDNNYTIEAKNKHYFSSTINSSDYTNLLPEVGITWNMRDFIDDTFDKDDQNFSLYGSINRSIGESDLIYRNRDVLSTSLPAKSFRNYNEYAETFWNKGLKPEIYLKSEIGLRYTTPNYAFSGEANFFFYNTRNFIAPVLNEKMEPFLDNIGRTRNHGYFLSLAYHKNHYRVNDFDYNVVLTFSQIRNKATALYGDKPFYHLAGFSDIATVFAKGESLGAIYDISQETGKYKKIGDPTPDFRMTLTPTFQYKDFELVFILEYSQSGDRWNGKRAILDNSEKPIVKEDYIEKATFLRLRDISLTYIIFRNKHDQLFKSMKATARGENLFLITPYKGGDPASSLFGYSSGNGLDMFNNPSTRNYLFSITFEL